MTMRKPTTPVLAALAVSACTTVAETGPVTRGSGQEVCRQTTSVNSHVRIKDCQPLRTVGLNEEDELLGAESESPFEIRRFPTDTSIPAAGGGGGAEGSCGGTTDID